MDAATRFDTQIVGALPVITDLLERMQLADHINALVPWEGDVPLGTLAEVLVINRLLRPKALFRVDEWARTAAVSDYFGLEPGQLNDDRLGRAHGNRISIGQKTGDNPLEVLFVPAGLETLAANAAF